jgi:hypothetical protein
LAGAYDFELNPTITGVVSVANGSETATANITINLTNVVEVTIENFATTVAENLVLNSVIGTVSASVANGAISLSDQNPAGALFIDSGTGQLTVANSTVFDFEVNTTISATISITGGSEVKTATVTITVSNVDEVVISNYLTTVAENLTTSTVLGTPTVTGNFPKTFAIVSQTPANGMTIDSSTGQLLSGNRSLYNYEDRTSLTATISVTSQSEVETATVTVTLTDLAFAEPANLIAKYLFAGNANDGSANGYNVSTNTAVLTSDRFGNANNAYSFSGSQYMEVPQITPFNIETISVSVWFKSNASSGSTTQTLAQRLLYMGSTAEGRQNWSANYNVQNNRKADFRYEPTVANGGGTQAVCTTDVNDNVWHHFVGVRDGAAKSIKIYIDGVLESTVSYSFVPVSADQNLQIGRSFPTTEQYYTGSMDDIRIFSSALSVADVTGMYEETTGN